MVNPLRDTRIALGLADNPPGGDPGEPFAALDGATCTPGTPGCAPLLCEAATSTKQRRWA